MPLTNSFTLFPISLPIYRTLATSAESRTLPTQLTRRKPHHLIPTRSADRSVDRKVHASHHPIVNYRPAHCMPQTSPPALIHKSIFSSRANAHYRTPSRLHFVSDCQPENLPPPPPASGSRWGSAAKLMC